MKRILMIAYHFPPLRGSSGIQRTLRFAKFLPEFGWEPLVLTIDARAYAETSDDQRAELPPGVRVRRAWGLDSSRHLAIAGRYPGALARPDRWATWWLGAVPAGYMLVQHYRPAVIWSTYPIATAHSIGATLQRVTGLPWVADFRDPMAQDGFPEDPRVWAAFKRIEDKVAARAKRLVFTTPSACETYRARYAERPREQFALIENGYDEETFPAVGDNPAAPLNPGALTLLHSGIVYPSERDPSQLMAALADLRHRTPGVATRLRVRFRAAVHDDLLRTLAREHGVEGIVEVLPAIAYREAIEEMLRADGLLVLQAASCNEQIPAKLYEYFRAGRPIIALTDPAGDTGQTLLGAGYDAIAPLDDAAAIARMLEDYVLAPQAFARSVTGDVSRYSRRGRTAELATLLDTLV